MPGIYGLAAAKEIRKRLDPSCQPVVIAITAHILLDGRERCLATGKEKYLITPVAVHDLQRVIKKNTPTIGEPV
jgi:CheY-like chemotaxis protein